MQEHIPELKMAGLFPLMAREKKSWLILLYLKGMYILRHIRPPVEVISVSKVERRGYT